MRTQGYLAPIKSEENGKRGKFPRMTVGELQKKKQHFRVTKSTKLRSDDPNMPTDYKNWAFRQQILKVGLRKMKDDYTEKILMPTVGKYGGESVMLYGCFSYKGFRNVVMVPGIMDYIK